MVKVRQERRIPTPVERKEMRRLEEEAERILDRLSRDPGNKELIDRLNRIDVAYVRLSGEKSMEY